MDHFSFNDTMYHNLARSFEVLGSITCGDVLEMQNLGNNVL